MLDVKGVLFLVEEFHRLAIFGMLAQLPPLLLGFFAGFTSFSSFATLTAFLIGLTALLAFAFSQLRSVDEFHRSG